MVKYTICVLKTCNFGLFDSIEEAEKVLKDKGWLKISNNCDTSFYGYYLPSKNDHSIISLCNIVPFVMPFSCNELWSDK